MSDERGQALVVAVLALGIAVAVIGGLRLAQDRIVTLARTHRAGEAAVEAATAAIADAYLAEIRRPASSTTSPRPAADVFGAVTSSVAREAARVAASDISVANGADVIDEVTVRCDRGQVDVSLRLAGVAYRAGFPASSCSPR